MQADQVISLLFLNNQGGTVKVNYNLIGLIEHTGKTSSQGHYIARLLRHNAWYVHNDRAITKAPPEQHEQYLDYACYASKLFFEERMKLRTIRASV